VGKLYQIVKSSNLVMWLLKRDNLPCGGVIKPELEVPDDDDVVPSHPNSSEVYATLIYM
jgi:hypothetical protein